MTDPAPVTAANPFRIDLPLYQGPIELLLYLIRRQELPVAELSLAKIVDQFHAYLDILTELDLTEVGEFIDVASTLIEWKSAAVLPSTTEVEEEPLPVDPAGGAELVQQLLQYKEIRDAAAVLQQRSDYWQQRFGRLHHDSTSSRVDPATQPIVDVQMWDLVSAFGRIMHESSGPPDTQVIYDDTPIHVYMQQIHRRLKNVERVRLIELIDGGMHKSALIGWFLATLELTRHHGAAVTESEHGDILVVKTDQYSDSLEVNEVDNYGGQAIQNAGLPSGR